MRARSGSVAAGTWCVAGALCVAGTLAAGPAQAAPGSASTNVIVVLRGDAQAGAGRPQLVASDETAARASVSSLGGRVTHSYRAIDALAVTLPASRVAALRTDPRVATVMPDLPRSLAAPAADQAVRGSTGAGTAPYAGTCPSNPKAPLLEPEALQTTHTSSLDPAAGTARSLGYTGAGVKVAFIADGLDPNAPDFIRADGSHVFTDYQDFSGDGPNSSSSGAEAFGDASSIAAQGRHVYDLSTFVNPAHPLPTGCTIRIEGISPGASLVGLKIFPNALLTAPTSVIVQAIDYAVSTDHVDVINESFGANPYPDTAQDPISLFNRDAVDAGVTVVASTGDAGIGSTMGTAGTDPWVIGAGASTQLRSYAQRTAYGFQFGNGSWVSNQVSALSSAGISQTNKVQDLLAPGDLGWAVCSSRLLPDGTQKFGGCLNGAGQPSDVQDFGGTSQSAPFTAGAAALVIQSYRKAHGGASPTPAQVRRVLDSSADDLGLPADEQGAGLLDTYRAVQLAASINGAGPQGAGLLAATARLSTVAAAGSTVTQQVTVQNDGVGAQRIDASVRDIGKPVDAHAQTVQLAANSKQTFLDGSGITRAYTKTTFTVAAGTDRLDALLSWPGVPANVRMSLFDPQGTYTGYTLPQAAAGNVGEFDVHQPAAGTWTALIWTSATTGYTGPVSLRTTDTASRSVGTVTPAGFILAQGASRTVTVTTTAPANDATAASVVFTGRFGQATTVPLVVRAVQKVTVGSPAAFAGVFRHGNGRSYSPAQTDTYLFDVPAGARDLDVDLALSGTPPNQVITHLSDPTGEPVSTDTSYRPKGTGTVSDPGVHVVHASPAAGRYQLTVELVNPVSGAALPQTFSGRVSLNSDTVTGQGLPAGSTLAHGRTVTAKVVVHNTGPQPLRYFVDPRGSGVRSYNLVPAAPATVALPLASETVPAWLVPTRVHQLNVGASATAPIQFDVMALDNPTAINAPSSPDVEATSSGNAATAVHAAPEVTASLWGAFPSLTGPTTGSKTGSVTMSARVLADTFAGNVTSSTGDALLATVDASAPAAHPLTIAPGHSATLTVTFTAAEAAGTDVMGTVYVDTLSPYGAQGLSGFGDEVAALPYSYTVG